MCPVHRGRPNIGGGAGIQHPDLSGAVTLPLPYITAEVPAANIDVDSALNALIGEKSSDWSHSWRAGGARARETRSSTMQ
jgi:hypothetical protein